VSTYPLHLQQSKIGGKKLVAYIKPMLAHLHDKPFDNDNWIFEIKWDGYRAIAELKGKNTRLYSRNGLSFKEKYPIIFQELASFKKNLVIDGEIVALDKKGMPSFQLLQQYEQAQVPLVYYVFDCLYVNGKSIENKPLLERKEILKSQLPESVLVKYCDHIEADGKAFFALTKKKGLEGMMAKKADSKYREGIRSADWLKVKHVLTEDAVIAGYTRPRGSRKYFGALVLGKYKNGKLQYIGHTGTGFNEENIKDVYTQMQSLITEESPFSENIAVNAPVTWIKPKLVCSLKYAEVTADGSRRQPVFMGLRIDLDARDVKE
jgi:bifunctional non-homologous end joining protein LigD